MTDQEKAIALRVANEMDAEQEPLYPAEMVEFAARFLEAIRAESEPVKVVGATESITMSFLIDTPLPVGTFLYATPPIPPHLALVPREPTEAMIKAHGRVPEEVCSAIYKAMLAAGEVK